MPSEVATPKIVPSSAEMSTASPAAPLIRLPMIGYRAERMDSGRLNRYAK